MCYIYVSISNWTIVLYNPEYWFHLYCSDVPGAPTNLHSVDESLTSITMAWIKPAFNGGSRIMAYVMESCEVGHSVWRSCCSVDAHRSKYVLKRKINIKERIVIPSQCYILTFLCALQMHCAKSSPWTRVLFPRCC